MDEIAKPRALARWAGWRLDRALQRVASGSAYRDPSDFHWQTTWLGKLIPWQAHWLFPLRTLGRYLPSR